MPNLDEQFFIDALNQNRDDIKAHVKKVIMDGLTKQFQWELPEVIRKQVSEFMVAEIAPEIQKQLIADKQLIVDAATEAVKGIAVEVGKAMQMSAAKNLANSYTVNDLAKKLFGGY